MSSPREEAGQRLASWSPIERTPQGWRVPSESGDGYYLVELNDEDGFTPENWWGRQPSCTCADNQIRHVRCKHIYAVFHLLRDLTNEVGRPESDHAGDTLIQGYPGFPGPGGASGADLITGFLNYLISWALERGPTAMLMYGGPPVSDMPLEALWSELTVYRLVAGIAGLAEAARYPNALEIEDLSDAFRSRWQAVVEALKARGIDPIYAELPQRPWADRPIVQPKPASPKPTGGVPI